MKKVILVFALMLSVNFFTKAASIVEEVRYPDICMDLLYGFINDYDNNHPGGELTDYEIQMLSFNLCNW